MKTKKRIIAIIMATVIIISLSLPVLAAPIADFTYSFSRGSYRYYGLFKQEQCSVKVTSRIGTIRFRAGWKSPSGGTTCYGSYKYAYPNSSATAYSAYLDCPHSYTPTF